MCRQRRAVEPVWRADIPDLWASQHCALRPHTPQLRTTCDKGPAPGTQELYCFLYAVHDILHTALYQTLMYSGTL